MTRSHSGPDGLLLLLLLLLAAPQLARAEGDCGAQCITQLEQCKKACKADLRCLAACEESTELCPKVCQTFMRGGPPAEMKKVLEKMVHEHEAKKAAKAAEAKSAAAKAAHKGPAKP